jgi:ubiquinone biosynthesis protein UbiJ
MSVSTAEVAALAALERAINAALSLDARTRGLVGALAGRVLSIEVTVPRLEVFVVPDAAGLRLAAHHEAQPDCTVSGAASDYIALATAADKASALVNGNLRVSGDSALLLDLEQALRTLDVDWEQRLAVLLGEAPAHQIGRAVRGSARFGRSARSAFERHLEEFIHEEVRLAPPRLEVEDFLGDLRAIAGRAERLEAGLRRLARRLDARAVRRGA